MPYSTPASPVGMISSHSTGRPGHRRSYSMFTDERGPGAFASLGSLPRRSAAPRQRTGALFHIRHDEDDSSPSDDESSTSRYEKHDLNDDDDDAHDGPPPPLKLKTSKSFQLKLNTIPPIVNLPVPFPRTSPSPSTPSPPPEKMDFPLPAPSPMQTKSPSPLPSPSPSVSVASPPPLSRPSPVRTSSSPILLANGKPLKPSLKSVSSPNFLPSDHMRPVHLRARSAPSTPSPEVLSGSVSPSTGASTPKNVHFATSDLEMVRVFNRSAKPASLLGDETETETEGEQLEYSGRYASAASGYPFPRVSRQGPLFLGRRASPPTEEVYFELDLSNYPVPSSHPPAHANVHLESIEITKPENNKAPLLTGKVLVKNVAFEKLIFVRFTLDDWQTTSEVSARYEASLRGLPDTFFPKTMGDILASRSPSAEENWDRFGFSIRLEDYLTSLETKTMWLVVRFTAPGFGEWWDNNGQRNYRFGFKKIVKAPEPVKEPAKALEPQGLSQKDRTLSAPAVILSHPPSTSTVSTTQENATAVPQVPTSDSPTRAATQLALSQATTQRLSKLNLKNYAAPSTGGSKSPTSPSSTISSTGSTQTGAVPRPPSPEKEQEKELKIPPSTPTIAVQRPSPPAMQYSSPRILAPSPIIASRGLTSLSNGTRSSPSPPMPAQPSFDASTAKPTTIPKGGVILSSPVPTSAPASKQPSPRPVLQSQPQTTVPAEAQVKKVQQLAGEQNTYPFPRMPSPDVPTELPALVHMHRTGSESTMDSELSDFEDDEGTQTEAPMSLDLKDDDSDTSDDDGDVSDAMTIRVRTPPPAPAAKPSPAAPRTFSPIPPSFQQQQMQSDSADSDSLYKAFLNQWCFATTTPPSPKHGSLHAESAGIESIGA